MSIPRLASFSVANRNGCGLRWPRDDRMAVVGGDLKVRGVESLRVADARQWRRWCAATPRAVNDDRRVADVESQGRRPCRKQGTNFVGFTFSLDSGSIA